MSGRPQVKISEDLRLCVEFRDVAAAALRISDHVVKTPLIANDELDRILSAKVLLKAETLQTTGSFKFRGALNRVLRMTPAERFGGTVRLYDRATEVRETIGAEIAAATGAVIIPPYDDPDIMAGQGTVALELAEQARERGVSLEMLAVSCSGGGLVAGCAIAMNGASPDTRVFCVEPAGFDDTARSLASGRRESNAPGARSLCDALQVATPGELTFPVNQALLAGAVAVTDDEVRRAMRLAYDLLKLVVEPGGVAPLAAALAGKLDVAGKTVALVLSGGNVDHDTFARCIAV